LAAAVLVSGQAMASQAQQVLSLVFLLEVVNKQTESDGLAAQMTTTLVA
jgi:hypothetical protein